jgi:D-alanine-D-alanine ligase
VLDVGTAALALGITEIVSPKDAFYTYEARYAAGRSVHLLPAPFSEPEYPEAFEWRVASVAINAHHALGCRDLSRADFVIGDDDDKAKITLLEVNTMPGFTPTSLYPEAAAHAGVPFAKLCDTLVKRAVARGAARRNAPKPLPA